MSARLSMILRNMFSTIFFLPCSDRQRPKKMHLIFSRVIFFFFVVYRNTKSKCTPFSFSRIGRDKREKNSDFITIFLRWKNEKSTQRTTEIAETNWIMYFRFTLIHCKLQMRQTFSFDSANFDCIKKMKRRKMRKKKIARANSILNQRRTKINEITLEKQKNRFVSINFRANK